MRVCMHEKERKREERERGRHIYSQLVYVFSVIRAVLAAALEHTYLPVAAVLNEFVYSFVLGFYLLFFPSSSLARVPFLHHVDPVGASVIFLPFLSPLFHPLFLPLFLSIFVVRRDYFDISEVGEEVRNLSRRQRTALTKSRAALSR